MTSQQIIFDTTNNRGGEIIFSGHKRIFIHIFFFIFLVLQVCFLLSQASRLFLLFWLPSPNKKSFTFGLSVKITRRYLLTNLATTILYCLKFHILSRFAISDQKLQWAFFEHIFPLSDSFFNVYFGAWNVFVQVLTKERLLNLQKYVIQFHLNLSTV